mgnify:CR=1 FL=1
MKIFLQRDVIIVHKRVKILVKKRKGMSPSTRLNKLHILKLHINCITDNLNSKICYFHFQNNHNETNEIELDNPQKIPTFFRTSKEAMKVTGHDVPWYKSNIIATSQSQLL